MYNQITYGEEITKQRLHQNKLTGNQNAARAASTSQTSCGAKTEAHSTLHDHSHFTWEHLISSTSQRRVIHLSKG